MKFDQKAMVFFKNHSCCYFEGHHGSKALDSTDYMDSGCMVLSTAYTPKYTFTTYL